MVFVYFFFYIGCKIFFFECDFLELDRIVGEFFQFGGVVVFVQFGMEDVLEGIDVVFVEGYCVVNGEEKVGVNYFQVDGNGYGKFIDEKVNGKNWYVVSIFGFKEGCFFYYG